MKATEQNIMMGLALGGGGLLITIVAIAAVRRRNKKRDANAQAFYNAVQSLYDTSRGGLRENAFDPDFHRQQTQCSSGQHPSRLGKDKSKEIAKKIYDAFGFFTDDETLVNGLLRTTRSKAELSEISEAFIELYDISLDTYLQSQFSDDWINGASELQTAMTIVRSKPNVKCLAGV